MSSSTSWGQGSSDWSAPASHWLGGEALWGVLCPKWSWVAMIDKKASRQGRRWFCLSGSVPVPSRLLLYSDLPA